MKRLSESLLVVVLCCALISACAPAKRKYDLYELRPVTGTPVDNDSYYVPPRRAQCLTIGEIPSCPAI